VAGEFGQGCGAFIMLRSKGVLRQLLCTSWRSMEIKLFKKQGLQISRRKTKLTTCKAYQENLADLANDPYKKIGPRH
jgi:hypothetical protein